MAKLDWFAALAPCLVLYADKELGMITDNKHTRNEMFEILSRVREWAGGEAQAMAWYHSQPIPSLGGCTPETLVQSGRAAAVRDYLDRIEIGGFA